MGRGIHVVGDMQLPLKDLSGGAHERGALDAGVLAFAFDGHLDIDAARNVLQVEKRVNQMEVDIDADKTNTTTTPSNMSLSCPDSIVVTMPSYPPTLAGDST